MNKTALITIVSNNYMPYAATLLNSVRETNPDYQRYVFLADKIHPDAQRWPGLFEIVEADSIGIPAFEDMALRYDIMEFNTAIKPFAITWLFENTDVDHVIYLDPDIRVYRKLDLLDEILRDRPSAVLTPHICKPVEDRHFPDDHSMLQAGVFNLGFIALSKTQEALDYLAWWGRRLQTQCYADMSNNLFTDQRWCDLAPCFIDRLHLLKDPGYNAAYWNLVQRPPLETESGLLTLDGKPLSFFHFSGLSASQEHLVSKHQNRFSWKDIKPLHALFEDYRRELLRNGWKDLSTISYTYGHAEELEIVPAVRRLYRSCFPNTNYSSTLTENFLIGLCNSDNHITQRGGVSITRLMSMIFSERPDLHSIFDLESGEGAAAYAKWFEDSAHREYGLDKRLALQALIKNSPQLERSKLPPRAVPNADRSYFYRKWRKYRKWYLKRICNHKAV